ncbi:hypothetical protein M8C21_021448 [Ambrosia artemisiifolia]|uniref:Uncharacterized protein n=1 Tax=Ambrosia artemisiifolia TaxID=4212 RepID=A0AAD5D2N1_AMBAR|nr:hypothetical protein M8C21_021448 [Ambrosia artemisiifolia]
MNTLLPTSVYKPPITNFFSINPSIHRLTPRIRTKRFDVRSSSNELDTKTVEGEDSKEESVDVTNTSSIGGPSSSGSAIDKDLKKVVQKTAATFAPRASTASKNPAVPGSTLYTVFEVQAYASMLLGGALSYNLIFPSNEPDIWRLMGMWSIWMFTIPSLRARDCSKNEKEALNYLFLLVPLLNVIIPFFLKSFAVVWSADTVAFFAMYAWKVVQKTAATFAPRASTASKNPAVPGSTLYTVFEVQAYASMLLGGALSYNLIFPSNEPDIWRLMGMWSIWMFTIPSLRARDCSKNEKEALNYLFLLVPLLNVIIPFFLKSFGVVWSADTVAFFAMYAWKVIFLFLFIAVF